MKKITFSFTLTPKQKDKLILDSIKLGYGSISAYLCRLIESGLNPDESIDLRLKLIEKKLDSLTDNVYADNKRKYSLLDTLFKKISIVYKIAAHILARTYLIEPGNITQDDYDRTKAYIDEQVRRIENSSTDKN
ncbi:MAG: hypothetical protein KAW12_11195 [Candidatus Aminicenantes bacterium]|nr:hypothetical protein [Candidatus Aminicenantes bacterium]